MAKDNNPFPWLVELDREVDGTKNVGFEFVTVSSAKASNFGVSIKFDGNFKGGIDPKEVKQFQINGKELTVTVSAVSKLEPGESATGQIEFHNDDRQK